MYVFRNMGSMYVHIFKRIQLCEQPGLSSEDHLRAQGSGSDVILQRLHCLRHPV